MPSSLNGRDSPDSVGTRDNNHGIRDNATKDVPQRDAPVAQYQAATGDSRQGNFSPTPSDQWNWMLSILEKAVDLEHVVSNEILLNCILTNLEPRLLDNLLASVLAAVEARKGQGGDDESIAGAPKEIRDDRKPAAREKSHAAEQSPEAGPDAMSHHGDDSVESTKKVVKFVNVVIDQFLLEYILTNFVEMRLLDNLLASVLAAVEARKGQGGDDESIADAPKETTDDSKPAAREKSHPAEQSPDAGPDAMSHHGDDSVLESTAGVARMHPRPDEDHVRAPPGKRVKRPVADGGDNVSEMIWRVFGPTIARPFPRPHEDHLMEPQETDISLGRGQGLWQLPQNEKFRNVMEKLAALYEKLESNKEKTNFGRRVVEAIKETGVGFRAQLEWVRATDDVARNTVQQQLREAVFRRKKVRAFFEANLQRFKFTRAEVVLAMPQNEIKAWIQWVEKASLDTVEQSMAVCKLQTEIKAWLQTRRLR